MKGWERCLRPTALRPLRGSWTRPRPFARRRTRSPTFRSEQDESRRRRTALAHIWPFASAAESPRTTRASCARVRSGPPSIRRFGRLCSPRPLSGKRGWTSTTTAMRSSTGTCPATRSTSSSAKVGCTATKVTPCEGTSLRATARVHRWFTRTTLGRRCSTSQRKTASTGSARFTRLGSRRLPEPRGSSVPCPALPLSKESHALRRLLRTVGAYRLVLGQPRQEDLLRYLGDSAPELDHLRINLEP